MSHYTTKNAENVFSSNYALYGETSQRVMNTLDGYSHDIGIYSIDESFPDLTGVPHDLNTYCREMITKVHKWTGIPVCVGIAHTKTLTKLANRIAREFPQLNGVHIPDAGEKRIKALKWVKVGDGRTLNKIISRMLYN